MIICIMRYFALKGHAGVYPDMSYWWVSHSMIPWDCKHLNNKDTNDSAFERRAQGWAVREQREGVGSDSLGLLQFIFFRVYLDTG